MRAWQHGSMKILRFSMLILAVTTTMVLACGDYATLNNPHTLAQLAVSADASHAESAIRRLRALGPKGLETFLDVHRASISDRNPIDPRFRKALEAIAGQRDAHASRLFWYTDLEQAKAVAQQLGRPILSLRLLGRLDEELSCANSRFFRTALYPNKEINAFLREGFVLHWESVRPAPRITVDFGDGRKLERTITGNSIHYVLAPDGQPVDAIPGLYGPKAFLAQLKRAADAASGYATTEPSARLSFVRAYHKERLASVLINWSAEFTQVTGQQIASPINRSSLEQRTTAEAWTALARLHSEDARLDAASHSLMRVKNPRAADAGRIAVAKSAAEDPLLRAMGEFERTMAEDTVRNEYQLHTQIHEWFAEGGPDVAEVRRLNNRVYAELFLMPGNDPWFGLRPPAGYSAVELDGASIAAVKGTQ
jgi:hypothetical protein